RLPYFASIRRAESIGRDEVHDAVELDERARRAASNGVDIEDHLRPGLGAVADPELAVVYVIVRLEQQLVTERKKAVYVGACAARADVADQHGASRRAVRLPQLRAMDTVVGGKEQRVADDGKLPRARVTDTGVHVLDEPDRLAVERHELRAMLVVRRDEVSFTAKRYEAGRRRGGRVEIDVREHRGSGFRAV